MYEIKTRLKEISLINIILYVLGIIYLFFGLFLLVLCIYSIFIEEVFVELIFLPTLFFISMSIVALHSASKPVEEKSGNESRISIGKIRKVLLVIILMELTVILLMPPPPATWMMSP